ncbi:hypothetical protein GW750_08850 [bacterium]|nr:hypothetical protein [bacterium]
MNMRANVSKSATQIKSESHYDQMNLNFDSFVKSAEASYVVETTAAQEAMRE